MRALLRKIYGKFNCVSIIMVHHVTNETPLVDSCIVSREKFSAYLENKKIIDVHTALRRIDKNTHGSYVITVDDALDDLFSTIYHEMKKRHLPFVAFISADLVGKPGYITRQQLLEMANDPCVTIGSHGCTHVRLDECSDKEVWYELHDSKIELEALIGKSVDLLAYPYGIAGRREIKMAEKVGYAYAFGVTPRKLNMFSRLFSRFMLPRYNFSNENDNPA